jgi:hypothetical protein
MVNFDASTPQLNLVKKLIESYMTLDAKNTEPLLSKNFQEELFPRSPNTPDESKKAHVEEWAAILSSMNKVEVGGVQQVPDIRLRD